MRLKKFPVKSNDLFAYDEKQLREILPEEIWHLILNKLDSRIDLQNCSNASPYYRFLLLSKRKKFLFPEVLPVILKTEKLNSKETVTFNDAEISTEASMQIDFKRMETEWEAEKRGNGVHLLESQMENGWIRIQTAWETLQEAWSAVKNAFDTVKRDNLEDAWDWSREIKICQGKIQESWNQMRVVWGIIGMKKEIGENISGQLDQIQLSLRSVQRNTSQIKNIQEWALALSKLWVVCME